MLLYGILEVGTYWFQTYYAYYTQNLDMIPLTFDTCLLYRNDGSAIVGLQTNDLLIVGTIEFIKEEERELKKAKFLAKPTEKLTPDHPIDFNGSIITIVSKIL